MLVPLLDTFHLIVQVGAVTQAAPGIYSVPVQGVARGRARVSIMLSDGTEAVAHYNVLPPFTQQV